MILFFGAGLFETGNMHPGRIQLSKDVFDRTILSCGIHGLQYDDDSVMVVGIELFLPAVQFFHYAGHPFFFYFLFIHVYVTRCGILTEVYLFSFFDTISFDIHESVPPYSQCI